MGARTNLPCETYGIIKFCILMYGVLDEEGGDSKKEQMWCRVFG